MLLNNIFYGIFFIIGLALCFFFIDSHPTYLNFSFRGLGTFLCLWGGILAWLYYQRKNLLFWKLFPPLFLGLALFLFGVSYTGEAFGDLNGIFVFGKILLTLGLSFFAFALICLFLISFGRMIWRKDDFFGTILFGFVGGTVLGFVLMSLGVWNLFTVLLLCLFAMWYARNYLGGCLKNVQNLKLKFSFLETFLVSFLLSVVVINFAQTFFPFSLGWDSSNHYLLTIQTLMDAGILRGGINPPFVEIFMSLWGSLGGIALVQFLFVAFGSASLLVFFSLAKSKKISSQKALLLSSALFLLPALQFQFSKDLKLDVIFLEFLLGSLYLWDRKFYKSSIFLLGVSPLLKLTALWFFPFVGLALLFKFKRKIFLFFCLLASPLLFWIGTVFVFSGNSFEHLMHSPRFYLTLQSNGVVFDPSFLGKPEKNIESTASVESTAFMEEVGRYSGFSSNVFWRLKDLFQNTEIPLSQKQFVDIGPFWALFFLFLIVGGLFRFIKYSKDYVLLMGLSGSFFLFWFFMGQGVAWYGIPFLAILFLWGGRYIFELVPKSLVFFFLGISLFLGGISRLSNMNQMSFLTSASWALFPTELNRDRLALMFFDEAFEVSKILNQNRAYRIYRVGTMARFWIEKGEPRILDDPQLDLFQSWFALSDFEGLLNGFEGNEIRYLLIDLGGSSIEKDKNGTLHQKFSNLESFIKWGVENKQMKLVFYGKRIALVEVSR